MYKLKEVNEVAVKLGEVYLDHEVIVTDPCYSEDTWCAEKYTLPLQGVYDAYYTTFENRVASIWVVLNAVNTVIKGDEICSCGVDSGQLGIFNLANYRKAVSKELFETTTTGEFPYEDWRRTWDENDSDEEKFYKACGNLTLSSDRVGILEGVGVVSSSGYGDGSYPLYELEGKDGTVVGLRVDFIKNEEEIF